MVRASCRHTPLVRGNAGWRAKRATDVVVAIIALGVFGPFILLLALAVRVNSSGPVLLRQQRIGLDGITFELLKFRSMRVLADGDTLWSVAPGDPRITTLGRLMRRSALDELPQLINVLKGEMSLVGPRPERPHFAAQFEDSVPGYAVRHQVRGGLTGWAQIHGWRGDTSIIERTRFDLDYIEHWSLRRDISILARTIPSMARAASADDAPPLGPGAAGVGPVVGGAVAGGAGSGAFGSPAGSGEERYGTGVPAGMVGPASPSRMLSVRSIWSSKR
jgi:lipopolysaccharide/colanic/teichoic acid biosynthesis glycosyltransferase